MRSAPAITLSPRPAPALVALDAAATRYERAVAALIAEVDQVGRLQARLAAMRRRLEAGRIVAPREAGNG